MAASREFVLTDVRMPFWRMVVVIFKLTLAAIPAAILLWMVTALIGVVVAALFGVTLLDSGGVFSQPSGGQ